MSLQETPKANRLHIAFFGRTNSGKSSLVNAISGQQAALVSSVPGTTTDPVYRNMEIHPIGPCVLIDTAGFGDESSLGEKRMEQTQKVADQADVAVMLFSGESMDLELKWMEKLRGKKVPVIPVISKSDTGLELESLTKRIHKEVGEAPLVVSAVKKENIDALKDRIAQCCPDFFEIDRITAHLVSPQDVVLLVMPQDIQAPKGRLILPQVQTIRDLLDQKCICICSTADQMDRALEALKHPPKLIITDSQVFGLVYEKKPKESLLTSFSILFARYKGDLEAFVQGAAAIDALTESSRVLIAEACTHNALDEDIGRVKIPNLLRKKVGKDLKVDVVSGADFPEDLTPYQLIIHCGGCMFNRKHILSRVERAKGQQVPITNYGVAIAKLTGILDKIDC